MNEQIDFYPKEQYKLVGYIEQSKGKQVAMRIWVVHFISAIILSIISTALATPSEASKIHISKSSISRFIDQPTITSTHISSKGYMWIGTQQGLYRFDASHRMKFDSRPNSQNYISASDIRAIGESTNGDLFFATFGGGLYSWDSEYFTLKPVSNNSNLNLDYLTHLYISSPNQIWLGSNTGISLHQIIKDTSGNLILSKPVIFLNNPPTALVGDKSGKVLISNKDGIYHYSSRSNFLTKIDLPKGLSASNITALYLPEKGELIVGTDGGKLYLLNSIRNPEITQELDLQHHSASITEIVKHRDIICIATSQGLFLAEKHLESYYIINTDNSQISHDHITDLYPSDTTLYVGTYQGFNNLLITSIELFDKANSKIHNDVLAFDQYLDKSILVGTFNGLYVHEMDTNQPTQITSNKTGPYLVDNRITSVMIQNDQIWLGLHRDGVQRISIDDNNRIKSSEHILTDLEVTDLISSKKGDIWVTTYSKGLFRLAGDGVQNIFVDPTNPGIPIMSIFESKTGDIYVGTETGLFKLDDAGNSFTEQGFKLPPASNSPLVLTMAESTTGDIWLGTKDQGIWILPYTASGSEIRTNKDILPMPIQRLSTIYGIEFDSNGDAWISSNNGIFKVSQKGSLLKQFTLHDGLQGLDFNFGASFKDSNGLIYFGGTKGYNRIDPSITRQGAPPPRISIGEIFMSDNSGSNIVSNSIPAQLVLSHSNYLVTFQLSVLDYLDPEKNQYRYKLENFDPNWIESGTRNTATYTNLPPGDYVFRVQGANSAGVWNREGISLPVTVLPPFWLTWWAFCIYALVGTVAFLFGKRLYDGYMIERRATEKAVEKLQANERADDMLQEQLESQDELIRSMYQHNIATLDYISTYIQARGSEADGSNHNDTQMPTDSITSLALLEKCVYFHGDTLSTNLRKFTDLITDRLLPNASVNSDTILVINDVPSILVPVEYATPLALLVYELMDNSLTHAFDSRSPANYVRIKLESTLDASTSIQVYTLTISDSGKSFPEDFDINSFNTGGFAVINKIIAMNDGDIHIDCEDGTRIEVSIPAAKIH